MERQPSSPGLRHHVPSPLGRAARGYLHCRCRRGCLRSPQTRLLEHGGRLCGTGDCLHPNGRRTLWRMGHVSNLHFQSPREGADGRHGPGLRQHPGVRAPTPQHWCPSGERPSSAMQEPPHHPGRVMRARRRPPSSKLTKWRSLRVLQRIYSDTVTLAIANLITNTATDTISDLLTDAATDTIAN